MHLEVRSRDRDGDARQAGTAAHVDDLGALGEGVLDDSTVEDVPIPEDRHLTRTDEPVADPGVGEDLCERLSERKALAEEPAGAFRGFRSLFHVKRHASFTSVCSSASASTSSAVESPWAAGASSEAAPAVPAAGRTTT
jgi:hypothetical protein